MRRAAGRLVLPFFLVAVLGACGGDPATEGTPSPGETGKAAYDRVVLEEAVTFFAPGGDDIVGAAGWYRMERAGDESVRFVPESGESFVALAVAGKHPMSLEVPAAVRITKEGGSEHFLLMLPGGVSLDARGSSTGVRQRALEDDLQEWEGMSAFVMMLLDRFEEIPPVHPLHHELRSAVESLGDPLRQAFEHLDMPGPVEPPVIEPILDALGRARDHFRERRAELQRRVEEMGEHEPEFGPMAHDILMEMTPFLDDVDRHVDRTADRLRELL